MRRSFRRTRERTEWVGAITVTPVAITAGTLSVITLLTQGQLEEWPNGRIDRAIGSLFISPATAPAAATGYGVFLGFTMRPAVALAAVPYDPEVNLDHRWIHWDLCFPQIGGAAAADSNAARWIGYFRFNYDLRIRRRIQEDNELVLMVKNSSFSGASIQISYAFRILVAAGRK